MAWRRLKSSGNGGRLNIPCGIIALTGWPSSSTEPYLGREIDDHLVKPLRLETMQMALERAESYLAKASIQA